MTATPVPVLQLDHKTMVNITIADTPGQAADVATPGNTIANGGKTFLVINNTIASPATVTIAYGQPYDGSVVTPITLTIPASKVEMIPLGASAQFGQSVLVTASAATVKFAAYSMP